MAFGNDVFQTVINLFPLNDALKLHKSSVVHGKRTKERLEYIIGKLEEKREDSNCLDKIMPQQTDKSLTGGGGGLGGGLGKRGHNAQQGSLRENTDCRICKYLKNNSWRGPHPLFKNHLDSSPMGCPNFLSSTTSNRRQTAISIKMCLTCLDPKVVYKSAHHQNCTKIPAGDQCKFTGCGRNIWVCDE